MEWGSLKHLIGEPLRFVDGTYEDYPPDGEVKIVEEYDNGILVDMEYKAVHGFGIGWTPRHIRYYVSKASLLCGDWILKRMNGERVVVERLLA